MEQFRQIGEVLGSIKALMVFRDDIQINNRQCFLLLDIFRLAYKTITEEIRENLRLEEKNIKWKALEQPLKELYRILKEGETYVRKCLDYRDFWGKAFYLHQNKECVELHIHNLLSCFPVVIEAIETAGEISGLDQDEMEKKKIVLASKYDEEWNDAKLFLRKFGKQYLVTREICNRIDRVWREDKLLLLETIREKKYTGLSTLTKHEQKLGDILMKKLDGSEEQKLLPAAILVGSKDYQVKRRLGNGNHYKEIQWLGESFALRHFFGEMEPLSTEISSLVSISHPNIIQIICTFHDVEKKESFLLMELMNKDLQSYMREICGPRRRIPFSLDAAVDLMLQIARGMEYLHSRKIYHGDLNPSNVLLKMRNAEADGHLLAKVTGFGLSPIKSYRRNTHTQNESNPIIWYAPEVLAEQEQEESNSPSKYTEKADVYSYAMVCFQILTGKVPFEHLEGDNKGWSIRGGERPLFPFPSPKYLVNLTKKCWHSDPVQRPSFSSICRILRYAKRFLLMNYCHDHDQPELSQPAVDFCDLEATFVKKFPVEGSLDLAPVSQIPFQMFAYRLLEQEKTRVNFKDKIWEPVIGHNRTRVTFKDSITWESASERASLFGDDCVSVVEDRISSVADTRSVRSEATGKRPTVAKRTTTTVKIKRSLSTGPPPKIQTPKPSPSPSATPRRTLKSKPERQSPTVKSSAGKKYVGPVADSVV